MPSPIEKHTPNKIIWHHSADASAGPQFFKINEDHKAKWNFASSLGYFGGYHYLIEKDGKVFQYRADDEVGAHDLGENIGSIGICLAGNFDAELPTKQQEQALAPLLKTILTKWKIRHNRIDPHRFGDTTNCPGLRLSDTWAREVYAEYEINFLTRIILWLLNTTPFIP